MFCVYSCRQGKIFWASVLFQDVCTLPLILFSALLGFGYIISQTYSWRSVLCEQLLGPCLGSHRFASTLSIDRWKWDFLHSTAWHSKILNRWRALKTCNHQNWLFVEVLPTGLPEEDYCPVPFICDVTRTASAWTPYDCSIQIFDREEIGSLRLFAFPVGHM